MYTTVSRVLQQLRQQGEGTEAQGAENLTDVLRAIDTVVALIDDRTNQWFAPRQSTRYYDASTWASGGTMDKHGRLWLDRALFSADSISVEGTALDENRYKLLPRGDQHFESVLFAYPSEDVFAASIKEDAIAIAGLWAYREDRNLGWVSSSDTVQANINDTEAVITVVDVDGLDLLMYAPRFSAGALIRIDDEFMQIRSVDAENNTISVKRGVNGSAAASHVAGAEIDTWESEAAITYAATRWATMIYKRRAQFEKTVIDGMGQITVWPTDMPDDVKPIIDRYQRVGNVRLM